MICRRSAIPMLITVTLLAAPTRGSQPAETLAFPNHALISRHVRLPIAEAYTSRSSHRTTLSRFAPWRYRLKSVLPETNPERTEESEVGFAVLPDNLISSISLDPAPCHIATRAPLRC